MKKPTFWYTSIYFIYFWSVSPFTLVANNQPSLDSIQDSSACSPTWKRLFAAWLLRRIFWLFVFIVQSSLNHSSRNLNQKSVFGYSRSEDGKLTLNDILDFYQVQILEFCRFFLPESFYWLFFEPSALFKNTPQTPFIKFWKNRLFDTTSIYYIFLIRILRSFQQSNY